jgi:hypothetical protein
MTQPNNELPDDIVLMRDLLNEAADLYLNLHSMASVRTKETSMFESDRDVLLVNVGRSTLADELDHVTSIYLFEAAHELKALATLLEANQIAGSMEVLSRAAIERCGRVSWLLDHDPALTPTARSARIALEVSVSWQHYRRIIQSLYPGSHEAVKDANTRFKEMRSQIEVIFPAIEKEQLVDDQQGVQLASPEIKSWVLGGISYPEYTELATWAWFGASDDSKSAKATYSMLCAFSHPNIAASREHQFISDNNLTFRYEVSYINRIVSNSVAAFDKAFQSFTSYFDRNFESVHIGLNSVHDRWPPLEDVGSAS